MKRFLLTIALALSCLSLRAGQEHLDYIRKYAPIAQEEMARTGVPASITLAQGLLESGAGNSTLARKANNHFGIKCGRKWTGKTIAHDDDAKGECFRVYDSPQESFKDHSNLLRFSDRYKFLFDYPKTAYKSWAFGLKAAGYATDPRYAQKVISMVETYNLMQYDVLPDVPKTPTQMETPRRVTVVRDNPKYSEELQISLGRPEFELNGVRFIYAKQGETYETIARRYDLFTSELRRFNDAPKGYEPLTGEVVFLQRKAGKAAPGLDVHFLEEETTLRDIAQRFAVRLKSIRRMNGYAKDYEPSQGEEIRLR